MMTGTPFVPPGERPRILITAPDVSEQGMEVLRASGAAIETMPAYPDPGQLRDTLASVNPHGLLARMSDIPPDVLDSAPALAAIARHGVGLDCIPVIEATKRGIPVTIAKGANSLSVAEHAIAFMLALAKGLGRLDARIKTGHWDKASHRSVDIAGATLLIVGHGAIGSRVSRLASGLGMTVLAHDPYIDSVPDHVERVSTLADGLARADIITLHCPLNDETRGMIGRDELAACRAGVLVVNTARGGIADEAALTEGLHAGQIGGAALDCFDQEPPTGSPILSAPNMLATPHIASTSASAFQAMGRQAAESLVNILVHNAPERCDIANPDWARARQAR